MNATTLFREIKTIIVDAAGTGAVYDIAINGSDIFAVGSREPVGKGDCFLAKIDANGTELWNVTWGSAWSDGVSSVRVNGSDIYTIGGYGVSKNWDWAAEIRKFNQTGVMEFQRTWNTIDNWDFGVLIEVNDSVFYAGIVTYNLEDDFLIKKYDFNGSELWTYTFPGSKSDLLSSMAVYGNYVYVCGGTYKYHNGTEGRMSDVFLLKLDGNTGGLVWAKYWGTNKYDFAADMLIKNSKIFVVCNSLNTSWDLVLLEYDLDGNLLNTTFWGDPQYDEKAITMAETNNSIIVVGTTNADAAQDVFISRILPDNSVISARWGNSSSYEVIASVIVNGSTLIACGQATFNGTRRGIISFFDIADSDEDGVIDSIESEKGTNSSNKDTDGDGLPDWFEITFELDPLSNDAGGDKDGDGLTNADEYRFSTNPSVKDSDGDGTDDKKEIDAGRSPLVPDIAISEEAAFPLLYIYSIAVITVGVIVAVLLLKWR